MSRNERRVMSVLEDAGGGLRPAEWQRACEPEGVKKRDFYRAKSRLEEKKKTTGNNGVFSAETLDQ